MHIKKTGRICSKLILVVKEACSMKNYVSFKKNNIQEAIKPGFFGTKKVGSLILN